MNTNTNISGGFQNPMQCEYPNCTSTEGNDYVRLPDEILPEWGKNEPIFLCHKHCGGHTPIKANESKVKEKLSSLYKQIRTINNRLQIIDKDSDEAVNLIGERDTLQEQFDVLYDQIESL